MQRLLPLRKVKRLGENYRALFPQGGKPQITGMFISRRRRENDVQTNGLGTIFAQQAFHQFGNAVTRPGPGPAVGKACLIDVYDQNPGFGLVNRQQLTQFIGCDVLGRQYDLAGRIGPLQQDDHQGNYPEGQQPSYQTGWGARPPCTRPVETTAYFLPQDATPAASNCLDKERW